MDEGEWWSSCGVLAGSTPQQRADAHLRIQQEGNCEWRSGPWPRCKQLSTRARLLVKEYHSGATVIPGPPGTATGTPRDMESGDPSLRTPISPNPLCGEVCCPFKEPLTLLTNDRRCGWEARGSRFQGLHGQESLSPEGGAGAGWGQRKQRPPHPLRSAVSCETHAGRLPGLSHLFMELRLRGHLRVEKFQLFTRHPQGPGEGPADMGNGLGIGRD